MTARVSGSSTRRRVVRTLVAVALYVLGARLVLGLAAVAADQLLLPRLFLTLLAALLVLGLLMIAGVAWRYDRVGEDG
jgi:hypothetical protein